MPCVSLAMIADEMLGFFGVLVAFVLVGVFWSSLLVMGKEKCPHMDLVSFVPWLGVSCSILCIN